MMNGVRQALRMVRALSGSRPSRNNGVPEAAGPVPGSCGRPAGGSDRRTPPCVEEVERYNAAARERGCKGVARAVERIGWERERLRTEYCGMAFATPLVLLSGCVGFGDEYPRVEGFSHREVGAVCLKGTTLAPRLGNRPHRVWETPSGMLNAIGLQNPGCRYVVEKILPSLDFDETRYIANLSGFTVEEYAEITSIFDDSPIDAMEVNISCPNVPEGGVLFGNDPDLSARVVEACRSRTEKPLITKLSPNQSDVGGNARRCIEAGSDGLAVANTFTGMAIDIEARRPVLGTNHGGLSGPAVKPMALLKVHEVYQVAHRHGVPIIGQGGIGSAEDAIEFLLAGATALGVGTALFYDPQVCRKVNQGVDDYLRRHDLDNVSRLVGSLMLHSGAEA